MPSSFTYLERPAARADVIYVYNAYIYIYILYIYICITPVEVAAFMYYMYLLKALRAFVTWSAAGEKRKETNKIK